MQEEGVGLRRCRAKMGVGLRIRAIKVQAGRWGVRVRARRRKMGVGLRRCRAKRGGAEEVQSKEGWG